MKNVYLLDFQDYLKALNFNFTIQYYSNNTFKLKVENKDGEIKTIYEGINGDYNAFLKAILQFAKQCAQGTK